MPAESVIERLRRLEAEATPGPWEWDGTVWNYDAEQDAPWLLGRNGTMGSPPHMQPRILHGEIKAENEADASLLVSARNALPLLLAVAEAADELYALRVRMTPEEFDSAEGSRAMAKLDLAVRALRAGGSDVR